MSKSPTPQLLGFPFAWGTGRFLLLSEVCEYDSGRQERLTGKCCRLQTTADVLEPEEEKRGKQENKRSVFQLNIAIKKKL